MYCSIGAFQNVPNVESNLFIRVLIISTEQGYIQLVRTKMFLEMGKDYASK